MKKKRKIIERVKEIIVSPSKKAKHTYQIDLGESPAKTMIWKDGVHVSNIIELTLYVRADPDEGPYLIIKERLR